MKTKKIDKCSIQLAQDRLIFYPGEQLHGNIILQLNRSMDIDYIQVSCKGEIKTKWKKTYFNEEREPYEVEYESKEKVFKDKQKVVGDGDRHALEAGAYSYPFCLNIPVEVPSSFEGPHGHIRYEIKMKIKKSWKKDLKLKRMFVVTEVIDCNQPIYRGGPGNSDEKTLGFLCCASGPLILSANLDRACYCPGEPILVTANVGNNTSREMDKLVVKLMQKVDYHAKSEHSSHSADTYTTENELVKLSSEKIEEGKSLRWESKLMLIPPAVPSLSNNKLIKVNYYVNVWLDVPMGFDLEFNLPITIGSVPYIPVYGIENGLDRNDIKVAKVGPPPLTFLGYPDLLPHVYCSPPNCKSVKLNKADEDPQDKEWQDDKYMPAYPYAMIGKKHESQFDYSSGAEAATPQEASKDSMPPIE